MEANPFSAAYVSRRFYALAGRLTFEFIVFSSLRLLIESKPYLGYY